MHIWVKNKVQKWNDDMDYVCSICNLQSFKVEDGYTIYNFNGVNCDYITCAEFIIKCIIE